MNRPEPTALQVRMLGPRAAAKGMTVAEYIAWADADQAKRVRHWDARAHAEALGRDGLRAALVQGLAGRGRMFVLGGAS